MHQATARTDRQLHECFSCGWRVRDPTGRVCERCGGQLRNISRSRDL
ncbi:MAG: rubrerythrin-like domain-containing protein [Halobacteriales archaeon]